MTDSSPHPVHTLFLSQQRRLAEMKRTTREQRIALLQTLKAAIQKRQGELCLALQQDLGKPEFEAQAFEVIFVIAEIDFAIRKLKGWMKPKWVGANLLNAMLRNRIVYEPKGLCLIIAPWNYPFQLLFAPLVSAIAAGNLCILKPSELAPQTSKVMAAIIKDNFPENEIALVEGGSEVAIELLKQPFHHIFFTGSTATGKKVMEAASAYLASVTLELGGKSPVVILPGADLKKTAAKVTWGKFVNAGQTCIAPDYVFVHEQAVDEFCELVGEQINKYYYKGKTLNTGDFGKIISASHFQRIKNLIEEGIASGGKVIVGGTFTESELRIHPTVIRLPYRKSKLMQEEIFGPVLPVLTYTHLPEVIDYINANNKPLALYVFGNSQEADALLNQTTSGGACVNDVMLQISNPHLPFGGVNSSGMGGSHGFHGFKTFSHERAVMYQARFFDFGSIIYPPYSGKERILKLLRKIM